jgi:hypothetical protein
MALNERADVLTSRDDAADDASTSDDQEPLGRVAGSNGAVDDDLDGADGQDRTARKRTARQRTLLVTGNGADVAAASTVDPLILTEDQDGADLAFGTEGAELDADDLDDEDLDEAVPAFVSGDDRTDQSTVVDEPPPDAITTAAVPVTAIGVAATTLTPLEPSPATMPLPATVLDGHGRTTTDEPAPPVMVPPPPKPQRRTRPRVRKVTRVVRSVDAWSVFKVALIFFVAMGVVIVTAGVLLWNLAQSTGTLDNVEGFFREAFNYDTFKLDSDVLFHALLTLTALFVVAGTGLAVVMAVLFNLIADLTGGVRVTVLEREVIARDDVRLVKRKARPPSGRARRAPPPPPAPPPVTG